MSIILNCFLPFRIMFKINFTAIYMYICDSIINAICFFFFNKDSRFHKINVNLVNSLKDISTQRILFGQVIPNWKYKIIYKQDIKCHLIFKSLSPNLLFEKIYTVVQNIKGNLKRSIIVKKLRIKQTLSKS